MKRRDFLKTAALGAAALTYPGLSRAAAPSARPNIILILADDLGYECIGADGSESYKTPQIDRLASTGMRFDRCYAQPLCTPTRAQLMTGLYNVRNYIHFGLLPPDQTTFANRLKAAGYATCIAGKWQLGNGLEGPKHFGFDEYCLWQLTRRPPRYANPGLEINGEIKDFSNGEYGPDLVSDYALDFITRQKDKPFFLYYPMMLTHAPYQPTPESPDWDPKAQGEQVNQGKQHFKDMVEHMDKLVGKVVEKVEALGLRERTLILFLGDNGTGHGTESRMRGLTILGGKGQMTETGMHVPMVANWPGVIKPSGVSRELVDTTDFMPTLCEAAGAPLSPETPCDGHSFMPQLRGEKGQPREWIYCWYAPNQNQVNEPREFAATERYKLFRDGSFYEVDAARLEEKALGAGQLTPEAEAARKKLQAVLDKYRDARPARLDAAALEAVGGKKKKNGKNKGQGVRAGGKGGNGKRAKRQQTEAAAAEE